MGILVILKLINHYDLSMSDDKRPAGGHRASWMPLSDLQLPWKPTLLFLATMYRPDSARSVGLQGLAIVLLQIPGTMYVIGMMTTGLTTKVSSH